MTHPARQPPPGLGRVQGAWPVPHHCRGPGSGHRDRRAAGAARVQAVWRAGPGSLRAPLSLCAWHGWDRAPRMERTPCRPRVAMPTAVRWPSHPRSGFGAFKPERTLPQPGSGQQSCLSHSVREQTEARPLKSAKARSQGGGLVHHGSLCCQGWRLGVSPPITETDSRDTCPRQAHRLGRGEEGRAMLR